MKDVVMIIVGVIVVAVLAYFLFLNPTTGLMKKGKDMINSGTDAITELQESLPSTIK